jgi:hypothetical protein
LENTVLDPPASNIHNSLKGDAVLHPSTTKMRFSTKLMFLTHENNET